VSPACDELPHRDLRKKGQELESFVGKCTPPKTNGWIPKMMGLGKGGSGFKYGHVWYLSQKESNLPFPSFLRGENVKLPGV